MFGDIGVWWYYYVPCTQACIPPFVVVGALPTPRHSPTTRIAAIDGLAVRITKPDVGNPAQYYNRKGTYSVNLQAICDHRCNFLWWSTRAPGSMFDALAFEMSTLSTRLDQLPDCYWFGETPPPTHFSPSLCIMMLFISEVFAARRRLRVAIAVH